MTRRIYKSRLFWLGLPGLVFLLWAWWDSGRHDSYVMWNRWSVVDDLRVNSGCIVWGRIKESLPSPVGMDYLSVDRYEMPADDSSGASRRRDRQFDFPAPLRWKVEVIETEGSRSDVLDVRVALWVMVLGYVAAWLGMLWWWQRRKRSLLAKAEVGGNPG